MSADTVSSLFPDRPIRPLPKRRIRERLTPDVAARIDYPVVLQSTTPVFLYPPYNARDEDAESSAHTSRNRLAEPRAQTGRRSGFGHGNDEPEAGSRRNTVTRPMSVRVPPKQDYSRHIKPQAPPSATSSVDGYYDEPFDNIIETPNNKKKRKVPTTGDTALNGSHGTHHVNHGVESPGPLVQSVEGPGELSSPMSSTYYGNGGFAPGNHNVSGPGRGRYGRVRNGRSPLRTLSDSSGNWAGRNGKLRPSPWTPQTSESTGIISTAIANAEKFPRHGQENQNLSLLHRRQKEETDPASTEFTFTCDSQVPGGITWPSIRDQHTSRTMGLPNRRQANGHGATPGAPTPSTRPPPAHTSQSTPASASSANPTLPTQPSPTTARRKPSRREVQRDINRQATARRRKQEDDNAQKGITRDQVALCDFCLYEAIYNEQPTALIRRYELKERKRLQKEEEIRRHIEKKSRKGKNPKASKTAAKKSALAQGPEDLTTSQADAQASLSSAAHEHGQGTESEENPDVEENDRPADDGGGGEPGPSPSSQQRPPGPPEPDDPAIHKKPPAK